MKKTIISLMAFLLCLAGCKESYVDDGTGVLRIDAESFDVDVNVPVAKSLTSADLEQYVISIIDSKGTTMREITFREAEQDGWKLTLLAGNYTLAVKSIAGAIPQAAFNQPVYGAQKDFTIVAGSTTVVGDISCKLLQAKVTVDYSDEFLEDVTGDGKCKISISPEHPLNYALQYNEGNPTYELSEGYFAVSGESSTMSVVYEGDIKGSKQVMSQTFMGIKACTWHKITIVKKYSGVGNASFDIVIDSIVDDEELRAGVNAEETVIGDDPDAPKGDGGIKLVSTCSYDITQPVVVPKVPDPFVLTLDAVVPNKVSKFTVGISSTNEDFVNAVIMANGSTTMDLINPSPGAIDIFTSILPFPYGDAVYGKTDVNFDLSAAQVPISAFKGTHTFVMHVQDQKGCKNDVSVVMLVD